MCPVVDHMTLWVLLWITMTTDFVVKFATVFAKAVIALLPRQILPLKKKVYTTCVFVQPVCESCGRLCINESFMTVDYISVMCCNLH